MKTKTKQTTARRRTITARVKTPAIRNGSLYAFKGQTVRAVQICNNGLRLVGFHGRLFGFARDTELRRINTEEVHKYLGD